METAQVMVARPGIFKSLVRFAMNRVWFVHPTAILIVQARPSLCLQTLVTAAKPSTHRLHLRNLFAGGRRYQIEPTEDGFRLTTTSKVAWRYRKRTSASTVLSALFVELDDRTTRIQMDAHIRLFYLLDVFLIPAFMTTILISAPWSPLVVAGLLGTLYTLSWFGHRYNAALEAHEMVYFIQTALEDLVPAPATSLGATTPGVVYDQREFENEWEKFYQAHKGE